MLREREAERGVGAAVAGDEAERQHEGDRQERPAHALNSVNRTISQDPRAGIRRKSAVTSAAKQDRGAGGGEPVEGEARGFGVLRLVGRIAQPRRIDPRRHHRKSRKTIWWSAGTSKVGDRNRMRAGRFAGGADTRRAGGSGVEERLDRCQCPTRSRTTRAATHGIHALTNCSRHGIVSAAAGLTRGAANAGVTARHRRLPGSPTLHAASTRRRSSARLPSDTRPPAMSTSSGPT